MGQKLAHGAEVCIGAEGMTRLVPSGPMCAAVERFFFLLAAERWVGEVQGADPVRP